MVAMVVIYRAHGFRIVIYTADHDPAHIHITGAGQAKVNLSGRDGKPELVSAVGIKQSDMRRLVSVISEHRNEFFEGMGAYPWHIRQMKSLLQRKLAEMRCWKRSPGLSLPATIAKPGA